MAHKLSLFSSTRMVAQTPIAPYIPDIYEEQDLKALLCDPIFWKHVWIVQELSLAPRVTLVCEGTELDWEILSTFLKDEPYLDAFHTSNERYAFELKLGVQLIREISINAKLRISAKC